MKPFNESLFVRWIESRFRASNAAHSAGDDAAVYQPRRGETLLLKADALVEGVHFDSQKSRPEDWGWKVVMKNASDMAAMGGEPSAFLLSLGLPPQVSERVVRRVYSGIRRACALTGCRLVGGDTTRASQMFLAGSMVGRVVNRPFLRTGARSGDWVFVTGPLGASYTTGHHLRFKPRLDAAKFLARNYPVRAMLDLSDGLSKDIREIGRKSRVGFFLNGPSIPLRVPGAGLRPAFMDGEDFELLFCLSSNEGGRLLADRRPGRVGIKFYRIGSVVSARRGFKYVDLSGVVKEIPAAKCHHFNRRRG